MTVLAVVVVIASAGVTRLERWLLRWEIMNRSLRPWRSVRSLGRAAAIGARRAAARGYGSRSVWQNQMVYLPTTLTEELGFYKEEGLDVDLQDFAGGSKAFAGARRRQRGRRIGFLRSHDPDGREGREARGLRDDAAIPRTRAGDLRRRRRGRPSCETEDGARPPPGSRLICCLNVSRCSGTVTSTSPGNRSIRHEGPRARGPSAASGSCDRRTRFTTSALPPTSACNAFEPPAIILEVDARGPPPCRNPAPPSASSADRHLVLPTDREPYLCAAARRAPIAAARPRNASDRQGRKNRFHDFQRKQPPLQSRHAALR